MAPTRTASPAPLINSAAREQARKEQEAAAAATPATSSSALPATPGGGGGADGSDLPRIGPSSPSPKAGATADAAAKAAGAAEEASEAAAILQIRLLAGARAVFQMTRICMGPLMVNMAAEYGYSNEDKGMILSAFAGGYALTQVVGGLAADKFGGAPVILFGLLSSASALLLLPLAAEAGVPQLYWLLWVMGFTQGPTYPAQLVTTAKWATGSLRSYASALGAAGSTAGSLLALGLTSPLASRLGWPLAAAAMGLSTLLFAALWGALGRSSPQAASASAAAERPSTSGDGATRHPTDMLLETGRTLSKYARILTAAPVIAVFTAHSVHNFVRYFLVGWMPTYFNDILLASPDAAAVLLLIPELMGLLVSIGSAHLGRELQRRGALTALGSRRLFASTAFLGAAGGLWLASEMTTAKSVTACLCVVQGLATLQGLGFGANYLDVSKYNGGVVTGVGNTVATGASFVAPVFASWILSAGGAHGAGLEEWRRLFVAFAASNLVGVAVFVPMSSVTPVDLLEQEDSASDKAKDD